MDGGGGIGSRQVGHQGSQGMATNGKEAGNSSVATEEAPVPDAPRQLSEAAQRALAEAAERRTAREAAESQAKAEAELGGRAGPDPVRYGDWENGGIASDF